ncbi:MAG TPA: DR2241 family protein, partial [Verrucomicrobiae bacterium]|nr:DR2241 family protein [Verrucomicrobiae bacterium]
MIVIENPALKEFAAHIGSELALAQVLIRRSGSGYELRHVEDRDAAAESLRVIKGNEARGLAQYTAKGVFRPLKSAPTLQRGWRMLPAGDAELEAALSQLYPGALADWHAARTANPPVTSFREFTNRQSGMYRIAAKLSDAQAAQVIRITCDKKSCLKRRLWSVAGLE